MPSSKHPIPFRGFDEKGKVHIYYNGGLPHWRQANCTYFVTYRQSDALPQPIIREFKHDRDKWLKHRGISVTEGMDWNRALAALSKEDHRTYEREMAKRLNKYLDAGYGSCVLKQAEVGKIESLTHFHNERVLTGDYVVMPNHVHVLMRPLDGYKLEDILQSIKSFTATKINRVLGQQGPFWMRDSYDHIVRDYEQLDAFKKYIKANPQKANLRTGDHIYQCAEYKLDE